MDDAQAGSLYDVLTVISETVKSREAWAPSLEVLKRELGWNGV